MPAHPMPERNRIVERASPLAARQPLNVAESITRDSKGSMPGDFAAHADRPRDPTRNDELFMEVNWKGAKGTSQRGRLSAPGKADGFTC
jgi:hypothetical protein